MKLTRWSAYQFKNGKTAQNRVVVPPMASQTADRQGFATEKTIQHYRSLSQSGAGLVFVEYSFVSSEGKGEVNQLGISQDGHVFGLSQISSAIRLEGALAGLQVVHAGSKTSTEIAGAKLQAPSAHPVPVKGWEPEVPFEMSEDQIQKWILDFTQAAARAQNAGFDFIEVHAAHGYGLNQWLSPLTNKRTDSFGGGIEGRAKLLFEIVKSIKVSAPELLVAVRLPAQDHHEGGLTFQEMIWVARHLEKLKVDLIDVSSGIGGWRRPTGHSGQGYLVADAYELKKHLSIPVIGVGGIETGAFIDQILELEKIDFAAVGRAILQNSLAWKDLNLTM